MDRCTYDVVASPLHDQSELDGLIGPVAGSLERLGASRREAESSVPHLVVVASGGTESTILDGLDRRELDAPGCPALLVAHPSHNSLPAALEALARLHQLGRRGRIVFLDGSDDDTLGEAIDDLTTWHRFHNTRLGLVGTASDWLVASTPTPETVAERWGPELVDVSIPDTIAAFGDVPVEIGRRVASLLGGRAASTLPAPHDVVRAARLDPALRRVIDQNDLDAITVRCFDFLGSIETSGCVALALLNDDGIVAGCEGDRSRRAIDAL